jgi:hypothetical protein
VDAWVKSHVTLTVLIVLGIYVAISILIVVAASL